MAATLTNATAAIRRAWGFTYSNYLAPALAFMTGNPNIDLSTAWTYGSSGPLTFNELYEAILTFSGTTPQSLDFTGGALQNPAKQTVNLASFRKVFIKNTNTSGDFAITGNACAVLGIASGFVLKPGASMDLEFAGATFPASAGGSSDTLTFTPTAGGTLQVLVLGIAA